MFISNCLSVDTQYGEIIKGDKETFESDGACECVLSHVQSCRLFVTLWIVAHHAPLSIEFFSRQEEWSGLPIPPPEDLPNPGIKSAFLCLLDWLKVMGMFIILIVVIVSWE